MLVKNKFLKGLSFSRNSIRCYRGDLLPEGAKAFINGKWINATGGRLFEVKNPYTREAVADVSSCDLQDAQLVKYLGLFDNRRSSIEAVAAAKQAFSKWAHEMSAKERSAILQKWFENLRDKENQLAELLTSEQGKPLAEAQTEIQYSASFFEWYAGEARRIYGEIVPASKLNRHHLHIREPIGVVGIFTPWNFPSAMIARKAAAALAAGCTVVVKPANETPLSALALAQAGKEAGLPNGVFNVIPVAHENIHEISTYMCASFDVDCISFTGSTTVGKILLSQSANSIKRVCLELGGNAPFIVFKSANIDQAVQGAIASKFRCSGQTCVAANRFFVENTIYDEFVEKMKAAMKKQLKYGNGLDKDVTQGPLINERALKKVKHLVDNAIENKAKLVLGGKVVPETTIYEPTLLTEIRGDLNIANEEIFGPVIALQNELEVLTKANNTRHGLAGYIYTKDISQIYRLSRDLQVGMLGINEGAISCAEAAFGGVKESGMGREGGGQGIDEFTQWKYVCINAE